MQIKGIDVSKHNGHINWSKVKSSGIKFVIIRAGYGSSTVDERFREYIEGAIEEKLGVGIYWFSYAISEEKAKEEAIKCMEVIKPYKSKINYPVFYDFEYDSINYARKNGISINKTKATNFANAFLEEINKGGYIPGLYTNIDFLNNYFGKSIEEKYDLWIAQYSSRCSYKGSHVMWQYSEKGKVDGISGDCDMDYCYKDYGKNSPDDSNNTEVKYNVILVKELQRALNKSYNSNLALDGDYGEQTELVVSKHPLSEDLIHKKLDHVEWLQKALRELGYNLAVDGFYGKDTKTAVEKYQKSKKLKVDGISGSQTQKSIVSLK